MICPGARVEDSEGYVVTPDYLENLTDEEYTVIVPTTAGANVLTTASCVSTLCHRLSCIHTKAG